MEPVWVCDLKEKKGIIDLWYKPCCHGLPVFGWWKCGVRSLELIGLRVTSTLCRFSPGCRFCFSQRCVGGSTFCGTAVPGSLGCRCVLQSDAFPGATAHTPSACLAGVLSTVPPYYPTLYTSKSSPLVGGPMISHDIITHRLNPALGKSKHMQQEDRT